MKQRRQKMVEEGQRKEVEGSERGGRRVDKRERKGEGDRKWEKWREKRGREASAREREREQFPQLPHLEAPLTCLART